MDKPDAPATAYDALVAAQCAVDSHESDLYVQDSETARAILKQYGLQGTPFVHQVNRSIWLDVPFQFSPWWRARQTRS